MRATIRQIQTFLLIHDEGSFAAAARRLDVSQVAISKQMAALERAVGGEVFDRRNGTRITLNARGRQLLEKAPEFLEKARGLDEDLQEESLPTLVRVATDDVLLNSIFHPSSVKFYHTHRDIQIEFVECEPALESIAAMHTNRIDLAYFTLPSSLGTVPGTLLASSPGGLYISPRLLDANAWRNDAKEPLPIILPLSGSKLERAMLKTLALAGITHYRVAAHVQFGNSIRDLAIEGIGACLLAKSRAADAVKAGQLVELSQINVRHTMGRYVFRTPSATSSQVQAVEAYLSSLIKDRENAW